MTICPGKDASGVACSRPQSICIARGFVQWGPQSPSGWACQLPLYNCQPSSGHLPRLHSCLPSPTARVLTGAYVPLHPHTQAGRLPPLALVTCQLPGLSPLVLVPVF